MSGTGLFYRPQKCQQTGVWISIHTLWGGHFYTLYIHNISHKQKPIFLTFRVPIPGVYIFLFTNQAKSVNLASIMQNELDVLNNMAVPAAAEPGEAELQNVLASLSPEEVAEARKSMLEIRKALEEMIAQGATQEQIEQMLAEVGLTLDQLEYAEQVLGLAEQNNVGIEI